MSFEIVVKPFFAIKGKRHTNGRLYREDRTAGKEILADHPSGTNAKERNCLRGPHFI